MHNIRLRIASGAFLAIVYLLVLFSSLLLYRILVMILFCGMLLESYFLAKNSLRDRLVLYVFIAISLICFLSVSHMKYAQYTLLWHATVIASYDSMAFFGGSYIGGRKLAEKISPSKTWSGFCAGILGSIISASLVTACFPREIFMHYSVFDCGITFPTIFLAISAQIGDLFESYYKRKHKVKDSGTIIPGHGGLLDRFDSCIFSGPGLLLLLIRA